MIPIMLSPYVRLVENRLTPNAVYYGIFHQLSGQVFNVDETIAGLLTNLQTSKKILIDPDELATRRDPAAVQLKQLIIREFLFSEGCDPLVLFADQYVVRPIQNPALGWRAPDGRVTVVRTSMSRLIFSPQKDEVPEVVEEVLPEIAGELFLQADGSKTLREIFVGLNLSDDLFRSGDFRAAINFLTNPDRQLIKLTPRREDIADPFSPCNIVPRGLYRSRKAESPADEQTTVADFHLHEIQDAAWEFDLIEPTINHAFRFPSDALDGFDYGARFFSSILSSEAVPGLKAADRINILEVGGGTGTFARSFNRQARATTNADIRYHILELSPTLAQAQKETLAGYFPVTHFQQDATKFHLPEQKFDLIISNEVIADFPVAQVRRVSDINKAADSQASTSPVRYEGDGSADIEKYDLKVDDAPDTFLVNSGVFRFIERAWEQLAPGGAVILSEYGSETIYPIQESHLNHEEFSIHFGHVAACARQVGFSSRLVPLTEFLEVNDQVLMLNGREEQIRCLDHVLQKHGLSLPYAAISEKEFEEKFGELIRRLGIVGVSFSSLNTGFHYGPEWKYFYVLILQKEK